MNVLIFGAELNGLNRQEAFALIGEYSLEFCSNIEYVNQFREITNVWSTSGEFVSRQELLEAFALM